MLRDVLLHVRRPIGDSFAVEAAFDLCVRHDAHLTALYVATIAPTAFTAPEAVALQMLEANREFDDAKRHRDTWEKRYAAHGIRGDWVVAQGDPVEAICHAGRAADLIVIERPATQPEAPIGWGITSRTVFAAATPVLAVPDTARGPVQTERIVVAWNASAEATRAVHGALPLLRRAAHVTVLSGKPTPSWSRQIPRLDLERYLARHGVRAQFRPFDAEGRDTGAALLDAATEAHADLVVMGAWGHSRVAQLVLGGSTRHLFQHSTVPLLVAH